MSSIQKESKGLILWYNFRTCEYEGLAEPPRDLRDYIPQSAPAQNLYALLVDGMGYSSILAAKEVLLAATGKKQQEQ